MHINNQAPQNNIIKLTVDNFIIHIEKDSTNKVLVHIVDQEEGSETYLILGEPGFTQRL